VYKARDLSLDRMVALKFLPPHMLDDPEQEQRFHQEAQAASSLDHPNVCTIHEINIAPDGRTYICMGYYEGETLRTILQRGAMSVADALDVGIQTARGLARAHEAQIIHRDIKPANIVVTQRGEVKILDFGVAKLERGTGLTKTGTTVGTAAYMSPEQARGDRVDGRTDIWALGVILYQALTGELPFKGEFEQAIVYFILNEDPKSARSVRPEVPEEVERIVNKALAKDLDERYASMNDFLTDLEKASGYTPTKIVVTEKNGKGPGRGVLIGAGGAIVVVIALGFAWMNRGDDAPATSAATPGRATVQSADAMTTPEKQAVQPTTPQPEPLAEAAFDSAARTVQNDPPPKQVVPPKAPDRTQAKSEAKKPKPAVAVDDFSATARESYAEMLRAKVTANEAGANQYAVDVVESAKRREASGDELRQNGNYRGASAEYDIAMSEYTRATTLAAVNRASELQEEVTTIKASVAQVRQSLTEHESLAAYKAGTIAELEGQAHLDAGDTEAALASYRKAAGEFEQAKKERADDRDRIAAIIKSYSRALEAEDSGTLSRLHDTFTPKMEDNWRQFFSVVSDLRARMDVLGVTFGDARANMDVDVTLTYEGADGSGTTNRWHLTMIEKDGTWLITEIKQ